MLRFIPAALILLALTAPAAAADFDIKWLDAAMGGYEFERGKAVSLWAEGDFTGAVEVSYSITYPRGGGGSGTITYRPDDRYHSMPLNPVDDEFWGGHVQGQVTISYIHPASGALVVKETVVQILDDDVFTIALHSVVLRETSEVQEIPFTFSPMPIVPVTFYVILNNYPAFKDDYELLGSPYTVEPGQTSGSLQIKVHPDGVTEGMEVFQLTPDGGYSETATLAILDVDGPATVSPADVHVLLGDTIDFELTLPWLAPWDVFAEPFVAAPHVASPDKGAAKIAAGTHSASLPMNADAPGSTTVEFRFDEGLGLDPVSASVYVWGGAVTVGDGSLVRLAPGAFAEIPIQIDPPPAQNEELPFQALTNGIVHTANLVTIDTAGSGTAAVSGLAPGKTTLQLFSPGGRVIGEVEVEVVQPSLLVTTVAPSTGSAAGGTDVTITGAGFVAPCRVEFGGVAAKNATVVSDTLIRATTPAHAPGKVDATVTCGDAFGTASGAFTYLRGRGRAVRH